MWVWWLIIVFIVWMGTLADKYGKKQHISNFSTEKASAWYFFMAVAVMVFFAGLRSVDGGGVKSVGDTRMYNILFKTLVKDNIFDFFAETKLESDWGFYALMSLFRQIFLVKEQGLFFICSLIIIGCIMYRFYKLSLGHSDLLFYLYVTLGYYVSSMNGIRQWLVSAILFIAFPLIQKRQTVWFFLIISALSIIHRSVIVFFLLYFVITKPAWGITAKWTIAMILLLLITYPITGKYISQFLEGSTYSQYSYDVVSGSGGTSIIRVITYILPMILAYYFRNDMKREPNYDIVINMATFDMLFMILAVQNWIYARFCIYFEPYLLIVYIWDLKYCFDKRSNKFVYATYIAYGAIWFWYQMYIAFGGQIYTSKVLGIGW